MGRFPVHPSSYKKQGEYQRVAVVNTLRWQNRPYLRWLTLFVSSGTLLCCALPILLVSLGLGSVVASLNYNLPGLMFLAEHKLWTLSLSALLLLFLAWMVWRPNQACPTDPELAAACLKAKHWNRRVLTLSVMIWVIGCFFSVILLPLRHLFAI